MPVLRNIGNLYCCREEGAQGDVQPISQAALVWKEDKVVWVGKERDCPPEFQSEATWDAQGKLVVPGLIDCHTHLAFGGWRKDEFEQRILGTTYREIAEGGGGILSTVKQTRDASEETLFERSLGFLQEIGRLGVTTIECKSGYGLNVLDELKLLRVYRRLQAAQPLGIVSTFLGAHTIPDEFKVARQKYISLLVEQLIPEIGREQLAQFIDVFVDDSAFSPEEARIIISRGREFGLRPKLHVDQLSDGRGANLAAELEAISADHLECVSDKGISDLARKGVVGVVLPLASLYAFKAPLNARRLIEAQVKVAVATDFNPGSAPSYHLPLAMMLACTLNRMTPNEVLKAVTIYAARAIGEEQNIGSLEPGKQADLILIDAVDPTEWLYHFRPNACLMTVKKGMRIH